VEYNFKTLSKPPYVIVIVVGLAGGLYFAYKLRGGSAKPAPELTSSAAQPVSDYSQTTQIDSLNTQLQKAQQLQTELEAKQDKAQKENAAALAALSANTTGERQQFEARLLAQQQQGATQYSAQIAALQAQIKALNDNLTAAQRAKESNTTKPLAPGILPISPVSPVRHETPQPLAPPKSPATNIPGGYPADCTGVGRRTFLFPYGTDAAAMRDLANRIKIQGHHASEHIPRFMAAMTAIMGAPNQSNLSAARNYTTGVWAAGSLNKVRRENGLKALPKPAIDELDATLRGWLAEGGGDWSYDMIAFLYNRYYFPYVC
jgi:hypothetical protein